MEDFSIEWSSRKCAKSVDVKVGELESGLKIEKDSKTGKKTTSAIVKYGADFSIAWIIRKRCKICSC